MRVAARTRESSATVLSGMVERPLANQDGCRWFTQFRWGLVSVADGDVEQAQAEDEEGGEEEVHRSAYYGGAVRAPRFTPGGGGSPGPR